MHGIYFISSLYAIFSLSLTCLQPIFWSSKNLFLCYHKAIVLERKTAKNIVKKIVWVIIKTSTKIALIIANCQLASSSFHVFFLASTTQTDCVFKTSTLFNLIEEKQSFRAKQTHSRLCCTAVSLVASSNSPLSAHGLTHSLSSQRFIMMLTEHVVQCEQQQNDVITPWFKYTADRLKEVLLSVSRIIATTPIVFETCSEGVPSLSNCLTYVSRVDQFCSNLVPRFFHLAATAPAERAWEWGWFTSSFVFSPLPTCFPTLFFAESRAGVPVPHDLGNVAFHVGPGHAHTPHLWPVQITQSVNADRTALDFIRTNSSFALVSCRTDQLWSRVLVSYPKV